MSPSARWASSRGPAVAAAARDRLASPFRRWSLTWRLLAVLVVLLVTVLGLSSAATARLMRGYLITRTKADLVAAASAVEGRNLQQYLYAQSEGMIPTSYTAVFTSPTGHQVVVAPRGAVHSPQVPPLAMDDPRVRERSTFFVPSVDATGPQWLVLSGRLANDTGTYAMATPMAGIEQTLRRMLVVNAAIGLIVTTGCVLIGWLGFRRAFRPLRAIEDTAAAIAAGDLTRRVPEHEANDEVASLSRSLNAMLTQVESSFLVREASEQRMRQFVTDASHELRTPLATIRGYAELYRQGAVVGPEATAGAMRRIEDEATRMGGLVDDLLTLARLDNERPLDRRDVDLTVLAGDAVQDARARAAGRPLRLLGLDGQPLGPASVVGDESRLRQVVTNLLANAMQHTPTETPVEVHVGRRGDRVRLEVRDHGPGIPPEKMRRVFERFYRDDPARGRRPSGGHGLGLAIVAAIVEAHSGRVGVAQTPGGGATFVVDLPAGDDPPSDLPADVEDPPT